jgi:hypothetical protein
LSDGLVCGAYLWLPERDLGFFEENEFDTFQPRPFSKSNKRAFVTAAGIRA